MNVADDITPIDLSKIESEVSKNMPPSPTLAAAGNVAIKKEQGRDVIGLSVGAPSFPEPPQVKEALIEAINNDPTITDYSPPPGFSELREVIADKMKKQNKLDVKPSQIMVANGGKGGIENLIEATINKGDKVALPDFAWVGYKPLIKKAGGIVVTINTNGTGKIIPEEYEKTLNEHKPKLTISNSPSNPGGQTNTFEEREGNSEVTLKYNKANPDSPTLFAQDDIYEHTKIDNPSIKLGPIEQKLMDSGALIILNGVSKGYRETGYRGGYTVASEELTSKFKKLQENSANGISTLTQVAMISAIRDTPEQYHDDNREVLRKDRDMAVAGFKKMGFKVTKPDGAFYVIVDATEKWGGKELPATAIRPSDNTEINIPEKDRKIQTSAKAANALLEVGDVALVEGDPFKMDESLKGILFRVSYNTPRLAEALERIEAVDKQVSEPVKSHTSDELKSKPPSSGGISSENIKRQQAGGRSGGYAL